MTAVYTAGMLTNSAMLNLNAPSMAKVRAGVASDRLPGLLAGSIDCVNAALFLASNFRGKVTGLNLPSR